jgi:hypothetical protein
LLLALGDEASGKLPATVFGQACPTRDVFAAMQDAEMSAEEVGKGRLFPCGGDVTFWAEESFSETVQSELFWCAPSLTRFCGQCLFKVSSERDDHRSILPEQKHCSVYHLVIWSAFS